MTGAQLTSRGGSFASASASAGSVTTSTVRSVTAVVSAPVESSVVVEAAVVSAPVLSSPVETSVEAPVETSVDTPVETSVETSVVVESSVEAPVVSAPVETSPSVETAPSAETVELTHVLRKVVEEVMAKSTTVPSLEATPSTEVTPDATVSEEVVGSSAEVEDHDDTPLADGESAGMTAVGGPPTAGKGQREDEDATLGERGLNQDTADIRDITLVRMGSMSCVNGDELRMILSIQNNNECLTIRDACVLYSDLKEMVEQFDRNVKMLKDEKSSRYVRSWHVYYARSILVITSGIAYVWLATTLHSWS